MPKNNAPVNPQEQEDAVANLLDLEDQVDNILKVGTSGAGSALTLNVDTDFQDSRCLRVWQCLKIKMWIQIFQGNTLKVGASGSGNALTLNVDTESSGQHP